MAMSSLQKKDVLEFASLAKLELTDKETILIGEELGAIIDYFEELKALRTDEVEPTSQTTGLVDVLGQDKINVERILPVDEALAGSEKIHNNAFVVSQLIDKDA